MQRAGMKCIEFHALPAHRHTGDDEPSTEQYPVNSKMKAYNWRFYLVSRRGLVWRDIIGYQTRPV